MFRSRSARIATLVAAGVLGFGGMAAASTPESPTFLAAVGQATENTEAEESIGEADDTEESLEVTEEETEKSTEETQKTEESPESTEETQKTEESPESTEETQKTEESPELTDLTEEPGAAPLPDLDDGTTLFDENFCEEGNHGKTVSAVARGLFDPEGKYPGEVTVEMAAQSSCGKLGEPDPEEPAPEESGETEIESDLETEKPKVKAERPGKGADKPDNGNGKSNRNGKRGG